MNLTSIKEKVLSMYSFIQKGLKKFKVIFKGILSFGLGVKFLD
jgi:hypothetical protein